MAKPFTLGQSTFRSTAGVVLFVGLSNVWARATNPTPRYLRFPQTAR
jgi:hypothetical protein